MFSLPVFGNDNRILGKEMLFLVRGVHGIRIFTRSLHTVARTLLLLRSIEFAIVIVKRVIPVAVAGLKVEVVDLTVFRLASVARRDTNYMSSGSTDDKRTDATLRTQLTTASTQLAVVL